MKKFIALTLGLLGLTALAIAQPVVQNQITGNEVWQAAQGPGGPGSWLGINSVRNSSAIATISGSGSVTTAMTTQQSTLVWTGAAPTTWAVTLPPNPPDGAAVVLATATTLTTMVTVTAASGDTTLSPAYSAQTITAGQSPKWQFLASTRTWYRIR